MQSIKRKIIDNFQRAHDSYDKVAHVQQTCANYLIEKLTSDFLYPGTETILDVGTGTGYIPELLLKIYPTSNYALNDISKNMLVQAQKKLNVFDNKYKLICDDIENIDLDNYDLITANLVLQWAINFNQLLAKLYYKSKTFAFSCPLLGTFMEWTSKFKDLHLAYPFSNYLTEQELAKLLLTFSPQQHFFSIKEYQLKFNNAIDFMEYLRNLGASTTNNRLDLSELRRVIRENNKFFTVTYRIFFGILRRY